MSRLVGPMSLLLLFSATDGCTRGSSRGAASRDAASKATRDDGIAREAGGMAAPVFLSPAVFSAPIAANRLNHELVVAGLVAAEGVVRVMALGDGAPVWTVDALKGVSWIADADLRLQPARAG